MQHCDTLFVINQNTSLARLKAIHQQDGIRSACVLATHRLFPAEEAELRRIFEHVESLSFADLVSDSDMSTCDETATRIMLGEGGAGAENYATRFMTLSVHEKNRCAHERLSQSHSFSNTYYQPELGVSASYWSAIGTLIEEPSQAPEDVVENHVNQWKALLRRALQIGRKRLAGEKRPASVIFDGSTPYVFLANLKRLRIRAGTVIAREAIRADSSKLDQYWLKKGYAPDRVQYCMTVHDYNATLARDLGGVLVFVDGYHPSNYPRTYLDSYGVNDGFVVRTMCDERWFRAFGKRTIKPPPFLEREYFETCHTERVTHVLIALNHAGDWTALINRSDTDNFVAATVSIARNIPEVEFRLRMHPTMDDPAHEGLNASARLARFIHEAGCTNLHISRSNLADDIEWCDLCVSEYSQVLLDAFRIGKLGISLNVTKRRSFMQDYVDLGFPQATGLNESLLKLQWMIRDPLSAALEQSDAVNRYNVLLAEWLDEGVLAGEKHTA